MSPPLRRQLFWGTVPVPYTVSWTGEEGQFFGDCRFAHGPALMQRHEPGLGKPVFGTPHSVRQREAVVCGLCDICGRSLKGRTKVSLSHARPQPHGAEGWAILQVEPMVHRECGLLSLKHCPSLRRDVLSGALRVRQVNKYRVQIAIIRPEIVQRETGVLTTAAGHAKVELLRWIDRGPAWLGLTL